MGNNTPGKAKILICGTLIRAGILSWIISTLITFNINGQNLQNSKISLTLENTPLAEVLHILELKTNFTFSYLNEELPLKEKVNLNVKDESLQQILEMLSDKFALTFTRINNIITIKKKGITNGKNKPQVFGTLRGIVRDSATSEILPYANIYIPGINTGASTDNRGFFIIPSIPAEKEYTINVTFVGYKPKSVALFIQKNKITDITIYLAKSAIELENVVISGEKIKNAVGTAKKLPIKEIENMSYGIETDAMRAIQLLPGVQSGGDVSARYYVRGGASNENLVLLNGTPVYNPFHALGILSAVDPDMINSIEFFKGGFDAMYGGQLSSIMDIITKDGNRNNFGATAAISQLTVKTALEGPVPGGSFIITGRKSYSNEILKKFTNNKSIPVDFYDASFKINYYNPDFIPISKFTVFGFISKDKIDYKDKLHANYNWSNSNIGFNWFTTPKNSPSFADFTFYYSGFSGSEIPASGTERRMENKLDDFSFKLDLSYVFNNKNEIYGGIKSNYIKTKLFLVNLREELKDVGSESAAFSIYAGFKLFSLKKLRADLGSRFNIVSLVKESSYYYEPRINLIYSLLPTLNLKAAWGIYQQELVTISDEDEILPLFEPWIITPEYLKTPNAVHYIGGFDYYLTEKLKLDAVGYYKVMHDLTLLNDQVIYPVDPQLINGSGESHGAELSINYTTGWINAQLSYSYSWTTKKIREIEFHPRYDSRNAVKININFDLGNNWRAGIMWHYSSGMPYTQIFGYYDKYIPSNISNPSSLFNNYEYFPLLAERNAAHLPDYHRLDMNLSKEFRLWFMNLSIDLNVINVYDRKNFFYFDTQTGKRVNMLPFLPTIDVKAEL